MLKNCPNVTSLNFEGCENIEGDIKYLKGCTKLKDVNLGCCKQITGNFEDLEGLGALLELSISGCKKIDCKNALEVLPTMPWAGQIQSLGLSRTNAEGRENVHKF